MARSENTPSASSHTGIPVEIEIYLNPDGSVTFADLEEHAVAIARELDPECQLACDVTPHSDNPAESSSQEQVIAE